LKDAEPEKSMEFTIEAENLTKEFPVLRGYKEILLYPWKRRMVTALSAVSLQVRNGEIFGLLGCNGAGKTTLIKTFCTLLFPTAGTARVCGHDIRRDDSEVRKRIGYVLSDERSFYWRLTGRQNLEFFAVLNNLNIERARERVRNILQLTRLEEMADRMFKDYSTGMRQMLAIARGLLTDPEVLFLDEPTRSLDPAASQHVRRFFKEVLSRRHGKTLFLATHNLREAEEICDRVAILHRGRIAAVGSVQELRKSFGDRQSRSFVLKNPDERKLEAYRRLHPVCRVEPMDGHPAGEEKVLKLTLPAAAGADNNRLVGEVLGLGGELLSFAEEEKSLEELFDSLTEPPRE
jgi:ABC-2 type transport system ATP-binding protein